MRKTVCVFTTEENKGKELYEAFENSEAVKNVRAEEGCEKYDFYFSEKRPNEVVLLEDWASKEALDAHAAGPYLPMVGEVQKQFNAKLKLYVFDYVREKK